MEIRERVRVQIESEKAFRTKPAFSEYIGIGHIVDEALIRNLEKILDTYTSNSVTGDEIKVVLENFVKHYRSGEPRFRDYKYGVGYIINTNREMVIDFDLKVGFSRVLIEKEQVQFQYVKDGCMIL